MTKISAHSGGGGGSRSVTYEHFEKSLASGAEFVEMDVRRTSDGVLVACHDERLADDGPFVADTRYAELDDLAGYVVPRVDELMRRLAGKVIGHLDLKDLDASDELMTMAFDLLGEGNFIFTSLEDASVARVKRRHPGTPAALSLGRGLKSVAPPKGLAIRLSELFPMSRLRACGADWVAVNYKLARLGVLSRCKRRGITTMVWTVNSADLIDRFLADARVDVLITDRPEYAVARRAELLSRAS